jgi:hypothetical protein
VSVIHIGVGGRRVYASSRTGAYRSIASWAMEFPLSLGRHSSHKTTANKVNNFDNFWKPGDITSTAAYAIWHLRNEGRL